MGGGNPSSGAQSGQLSFGGGSGGYNTAFDPKEFNKRIGSDIAAAYGQGPADPFNKTLYTGMGDTTKGAMSGLMDYAGGAPGQIYGSGIRNALTYAGGMAGGAGPSLTEQTLMGVAQGNQFGMNDPGYARIRQGAIDDTITATNSPFLSSGQYGSDKHKEAIGRGVGGALAGLDYQNYQNDIARQERALGAIEGQRQTGVMNTFAAQNQLPGLFQAGTAPSQLQLGVGQMQDADALAKRQAEFELHQRTSDPNYTHIAKYLNLGSQQGQNPQPDKQPGLFDWLGLGIGAAGVFL